MNDNIFRGVVHGRSVELESISGLEDGTAVEVRLVPVTKFEPSIEGLRRCAGILEQDWTDEDDLILQQIYEERKRSTVRELPE